jgi:hypothetical protein
VVPLEYNYRDPDELEARDISWRSESASSLA